MKTLRNVIKCFNLLGAQKYLETHFTKLSYFIRELISALEPVKYGVEALCRQDATLLTSEKIHKFVLEKLDSQNTIIANKLKDSLQSRIDSRRNINLIHLYEYLNDHTFLKNLEGSSRQKGKA